MKSPYIQLSKVCGMYRRPREFIANRYLLLTCFCGRFTLSSRCNNSGSSVGPRSTDPPFSHHTSSDGSILSLLQSYRALYPSPPHFWYEQVEQAEKMARNTEYLLQRAGVAPIPNITFPITKHTEGSRLGKKSSFCIVCSCVGRRSLSLPHGIGKGRPGQSAKWKRREG